MEDESDCQKCNVHGPGSVDACVPEYTTLKTLEVSRDIAAAMEFVLEKKLLVDLELMVWSVDIFSVADFENT